MLYLFFGKPSFFQPRSLDNDLGDVIKAGINNAFDWGRNPFILEAPRATPHVNQNVRDH